LTARRKTCCQRETDPAAELNVSLVSELDEDDCYKRRKPLRIQNRVSPILTALTSKVLKVSGNQRTPFKEKRAGKPLSPPVEEPERLPLRIHIREQNIVQQWK